MDHMDLGVLDSGDLLVTLVVAEAVVPLAVDIVETVGVQYLVNQCLSILDRVVNRVVMDLEDLVIEVLHI
jgi:hypothetical protein